MRVDVNVNLIEEGTGRAVTPRVELKNINAINGIEAAISAELARQHTLLQSNPAELRQETRLYSPELNQTVLLRVKDTSESYRFLPEYDLPMYDLNLTEHLSDIPFTRHQIIQEQLNSYPNLCPDLLLRLRSSNSNLAILFNDCLPLVNDQRFLLNWCLGELLAILNREVIESIHFTPKSFAQLVDCVASGSLDKELAKSEMTAALKYARDLENISSKPSLLNHQELDTEIDNLLNKHPDRVQFLKSPQGLKRGSVDFFIGPLLKQFRGRTSAQDLAVRIKQRLEK